MVLCEVCNKHVSKIRLQKHKQKVHPNLSKSPAAPIPQEQRIDPCTAALALHACVPNGKIERGILLADAARELGHSKLTKEVSQALNKALNAEKKAGRLCTLRGHVWKPRKK